MTRTRASAKAAGTRHESAIARYLAEHIDDRIERRAKTGSKDRGDIGGVRALGGRVVVECKDTSRVSIGTWLTEAELERGNDDAIAGLVVAKRRGRGDPCDQLVVKTVRDLVALLTGVRPSRACARAGARSSTPRAGGTTTGCCSGTVPAGRSCASGNSPRTIRLAISMLRFSQTPRRHSKYGST